MKKLGMSLAMVALLGCTSCEAVCGAIGDGTGVVDEVVADLVGMVPVVGPFASELTGIGFQIIRTTVCAPVTIGEEIQEMTGVTLDPTRTVKIEEPGGS